jgi:hypothetical protein
MFSQRGQIFQRVASSGIFSDYGGLNACLNLRLGCGFTTVSKRHFELQQKQGGIGNQK